MTETIPFSRDDYAHMARAIRLAERGLYSTDPNPRVGCVIVKNGTVVGEGWHQRAGQEHAEIHALREAGSEAGKATVYVSLEPCSHHGRTGPCSQALLEAGVNRVVAAMLDPNPQVAGSGLAMLRKAAISTQCGLLEEQARALNPGYLKRMSQGLPWVRVKLASSMDGHTALADGGSHWITGEAGRADVHRLRARSSVILTGIGTVLADNPRLDARPDLPGGSYLQPSLAIVDSSLRCPPSARCLSSTGSRSVGLYHCHGDPDRYPDTVQLVRVDSDHKGKQVDLRKVLALLASQGANEVMVEAGPILAGALWQGALADELIVYMAPVFLAEGAKPLLSLEPLTSMAGRYVLQCSDLRAVGDDWRFTLRRPQNAPYEFGLTEEI